MYNAIYVNMKWTVYLLFSIYLNRYLYINWVIVLNKKNWTNHYRHVLCILSAICCKIPSVFRVCFSKFPTPISSLSEGPLNSPVTIVLMPRLYLWSTLCTFGCFFHTTIGKKRYSKSRLLTKQTLNSGKTA